MRHVHTIRAEDVGRPWIKIEGRTRMVSGFLGRVLRRDVGKRVYLDDRTDTIQVENDEQRQRRTGDPDPNLVGLKPGDRVELRLRPHRAAHHDRPAHAEEAHLLTPTACKRKGTTTMIIANRYDDGSVEKLPPDKVALAVAEACAFIVWADKVARFEHEDGTPVEFDITVRIKNPVPSPEETGSCECPSCGQTDHFVGYDERACTRQDFHFRDGDVEYDVYEDCGDPSPYTLIRCGAPLCDTIVWQEYLDGWTS